jgi:hypothetical protein
VQKTPRNNHEPLASHRRRPPSLAAARRGRPDVAEGPRARERVRGERRHGVRMCAVQVQVREDCCRVGECSGVHIQVGQSHRAMSEAGLLTLLLFLITANLNFKSIHTLFY